MIADPEMPGSKQPYHAAAEMPFSKGEEHVRRAVESSRGLALEALLASLKGLQSKGHEVGACGNLRGSGKPLPDLRSILAAHPLIHTAEGEMFRDVLDWAAREAGLRVVATREKELDADSLKRLDSLGKLIGPPWRQDQKYAALAGFLAL